MIFARYFRRDLVTGFEACLVDIAVIPRGLTLQQSHATAVAFSDRARASGAVAYQLYEGDSFMYARPISLTHLLV